MLQPREYQTEALNAVMQKYKDGITRQLVSLPTGCGKTIIFGLVAEAFKAKTLVLAHREELLHQAQQKIKLVYPDADTGILQAEERGGLDAEICIASVQTAIHHTAELAERNYRLLICDEAHHAVSNSYTKIFRDLGFLQDEQDKLLLGVTATAFRGDNAALGAVFEEIVFERSIAAMIKGGYLCPPRGLQFATHTNIADVDVQRGDFNASQLSKVINTERRNNLIVEAYKEHGENRHGVVFAVSVDHARDLAVAFQEAGIACDLVYGDMPKEARRDILKRYENHELQILTNVGVLTEGWDVPDTDIILMARPTKSKTLYIQCIGRGLRLAPGKQDCLIMDFVDIARQHNICSFGTLLGEQLKPKRGGNKGKGGGYAGDVDEIQLDSSGGIISREGQEIELIQQSQFVWERMLDDYRIKFMNGTSVWCQAVEGGFTTFFVEESGETRKLSDIVLPLGYAMGVCEDFVRKNSISLHSRKDAPWRKDSATEKQINALQKMGIDFNPGLTKGEAADLMNAKISVPATDKQKYFIAKNNLHPNPQFLTKREASKIISAYKQVS